MAELIEKDTFLGSIEKIKSNLSEGSYPDEDMNEELDFAIRRNIKAGLTWLERNRNYPYMWKEEEALLYNQVKFVSANLWRQIDRVELWQTESGESCLVQDLRAARSIEDIPRRHRDNYLRTADGKVGYPKWYVKSLGSQGVVAAVVQPGSNSPEEDHRTVFDCWPTPDPTLSLFLKVKGYARTVIDPTITDTADDFYHYFFAQGWDVLEGIVMMRTSRFLQDTDLFVEWSGLFDMAMRGLNQEMDAEEFGGEFAESLQMQYVGENYDEYDVREIPHGRQRV